MDERHKYSVNAASLLPCPDDLNNERVEVIGQQAAIAIINQDIRPSENTTSFTIGLIDPYRLTQDCLAKAFSGLHPEIAIHAFITARECLAKAPIGLDIIIYYFHGNEIFKGDSIQSIAALCQAFHTVPVIILSDADCSQLPKITRAVMKSGARGFVSTQTSDLPITLAAARLIKEGGIFVPTYLLPTAQSNGEQTRRKRLTAREDEILRTLREGKANKIIAYELGLSESTVKVHIRNIMRKMGATNRTQAAYIAQTLSMDCEDPETSGAEPLEAITLIGGSPSHGYSSKYPIQSHHCN
jgi:DNA-binding NarL/FixJ family response regulator